MPFHDFDLGSEKTIDKVNLLISPNYEAKGSMTFVPRHSTSTRGNPGNPIPEIPLTPNPPKRQLWDDFCIPNLA